MTRQNRWSHYSQNHRHQLKRKRWGEGGGGGGAGTVDAVEVGVQGNRLKSRDKSKLTLFCKKKTQGKESLREKRFLVFVKDIKDGRHRDIWENVK